MDKTIHSVICDFFYLYWIFNIIIDQNMLDTLAAVIWLAKPISQQACL